MQQPVKTLRPTAERGRGDCPPPLILQPTLREILCVCPQATSYFGHYGPKYSQFFTSELCMLVLGVGLVERTGLL